MDGLSRILDALMTKEFWSSLFTWFLICWAVALTVNYLMLSRKYDKCVDALMEKK